MKKYNMSTIEEFLNIVRKNLIMVGLIKMEKDMKSSMMGSRIHYNHLKK